MIPKERTEVRASVSFPDTTLSDGKYIMRVNLFRSPSVVLYGRWAEESIRRYCVTQAKKQRYGRVTLDIEYSYLDGTGDSLTVNL